MTADRQLQSPPLIKLEDYRVTDYLVPEISLDFVLRETASVVTALLKIQKNPVVATVQPTLVLHGENLELLSLRINGRPLTASEFKVDAQSLTITTVPDQFELEIVTRINPQANTSLNGLYLSGGDFCTQCEAEGFRRITYMYDRPDVLARYRTRICADKKTYPILLSNGNPLAKGVDGDSHWALWEDPFPKPTYLFALVAGDLACVKDHFVTASGREVDLRIYVQHHNADKCDHAMRSLKNAMRWDEEVYGREYDLDIYMIVAVDDFNMGAMENKGLNVFNSKCVLAKPETATDGDYQSIEGIVGHEYFHNWSGNRVTCRDWFQLSLKEGFTVFRDQEFSAAMSSAGVKRISEVNVLRNHQFREDSGPMAHPVRPSAYVEINNFYTVTIYNKGAEVVRMLQFLLGTEGFRAGTDLYFKRHDGQAVTTEDFVKAMEDANGRDFSQFRRWYSQAGTPQLHVETHYDEPRQTYLVTIKQTCGPSPGQTQKLPFHIPIALGLLDASGQDMPLQLRGCTQRPVTTIVLQLTEAEQTFEFTHVPERPVPSVLRGFSAPVKVDINLSREQRAFLMAHDTDDFNRWDAGQQLAVEVALELIDCYQRGVPLTMDSSLLQAVGVVLNRPGPDLALAAQAISLPSETYIAEAMAVIDPLAIHHVREFMARSIGMAFNDRLLALYRDHHSVAPYSIEQKAMGRRAFKNSCLAYLMYLQLPQAIALCTAQFETANNMTDSIVALGLLVNVEGEQRQRCLDKFYQQWQDDTLVLDKWLALQAMSRLPGTLQRVKELCQFSGFSLKNPNKVRALLGSFSQGNPLHFHAADGEAYIFVADRVLELDALNPQAAARLVGVFTNWRRYDVQRQQQIKTQLQRIQANAALSNDVYEVVNKSLGAN